MTFWNRKSKPSDDTCLDPVGSTAGAYSVPLDAVVNRVSQPGTIIPCENPKRLRKVQSGFEWFEWSHGGKGVPWRINTEEFNQMLMDGWEIVDICNSFTLLKRPTFVHFLDTPKAAKKDKPYKPDLAGAAKGGKRMTK